MPVAHGENFRFRGPEPLKRRWVETCEKKVIPQNDAFLSILGFFLDQDSIVQSMILGQIEPDKELVHFVLKRLESKAKAGK